MSTLPLATAAQLTLADTVDESLAAALAGRDATCLWCGGHDVGPARRTSGAVRRRPLPAAAASSTGVVPRHLREVSA